MHDHDLDLVAALAEGSASSAESDRAREWISSCEVCSQEFDYQQLALATLGGVEPVVLTDLERARLHRGVRESIASQELATTHDHRPAKNSMLWMKILAGSAAAVLVLVVSFGVIVPSFTGSDGAADFAAETAKTTAAATEAPASASLATDDELSMASEAGVGGMAIPPPVQTFGDITLEELTAMAAPIEMFDAAGATLADAEQAPREAPLPADRLAYDRAIEEPLTCRDEGPALLDADVLWLGIATLDGQVIELYRSESSLVALESGTCTIVFPTE